MLTRDRDLSLHDFARGSSFFATVSTMEGKTGLHRRETLKLDGNHHSLSVPAAN